MSNRRRKPRIAICYDFDGTLSPGNMQEFDFLPQLEIKPRQFWKKVKKEAKKNNADEILVYMTQMLKEANNREVKITKKAFRDYGKTVELFTGVKTWFNRINTYAGSKAIIEHYIVSSGIKEMIEGTKINREFKKIFASSFFYDQHNVAVGSAIALNYTTKTQMLFRINKGVLNIWDNEKLNKYILKEERPIPFANMIYIGDGLTDVPCMKLIKQKGGHSVAVYKPKSSSKTASELLDQDRCDFIAPADYSKGKRLESIITAIIDKIIADFKLNKLK